VVVKKEVLEALDSLLGCFLCGHFDEAVAARLTIFSPANNRDSHNLTTCLRFSENLAHLLFPRFEVQVLHENLPGLLL